MTPAVLAALVPLLATLPSQEAPDLAARIEAIRAAVGVPALGGARITLEGEPEVWVAGTRAAGAREAVTASDRWHLGSCTKSMTATLIALLVERGDLSWDTPLGEALPELVEEMDLDYGDVTLVELLGHRAGLPANPDFGTLLSMRTSRDPVVEQRARIVAWALRQPPLPHGTFLYSNTGFMVAGHLAERATGQSWEELMRTLLFEPLGMESAGFGPPGLGEEGVTQIWGHAPEGAPVPPGPLADNPAALGPAGTVHASLADWARYARLHLAGAHGDVKVGEVTLTRASFERLHTGLSGPGQPYGYGWVNHRRDWAGGDGKTLWHNGSNTMWFCELWLGLENGVAVLAATNIAAARGPEACGQVATLLVEDWKRQRAERR